MLNNIHSTLFVVNKQTIVLTERLIYIYIYIYSPPSTHVQCSLLHWMHAGIAPGQQLPFAVALKGTGSTQRVKDEAAGYERMYPNIKIVWQGSAYFDTAATLRALAKLFEDKRVMPDGEYALVLGDNHKPHRYPLVRKLCAENGYLYHYGPPNTTHVRNATTI